MSENHKYYYMRLKENFFDDEGMKIMESMTDGYLYSNILLKMYLASLKSNGRLMLNDCIPYDAQMIASVTGHQVGTVERALKVFHKLGLIEVLDNGAIYMLNIQEFIGQGSSEGDRKKRFRQQIEAEKMVRGQMSDKCPPEIEIEIEKELEIDTEKELERKKETVSCSEIAKMFNAICVSLPKVTSLSEARKKAIRARLKQYGLDDFQRLFEKAEASAFLKGANARNWSANFDWLIRDANMAKVLDGNYDGSAPAKTGAAQQLEDSYRMIREWSERDD